ncbi:phage tail protein [Streptacidiphilus anmyonensis]|uniref:phage tail protein n=1 Tax=Streptacidiphilus anmyonensis TaxID=405782 RepID=UPI0005A98C27|nr:phage tail protein [Streptacidiphilus anmyonensis]
MTLQIPTTGSGGPAAAMLSRANTLIGGMFGTTGMAHRFRVLIDTPEYNLGTWSKVSGLQVNWRVCEYRTGAGWNSLVQFPGQTTYQLIKLSRAACRDSETVQRWLKNTAVNASFSTGEISMVDWLGLPVVTWELTAFFPAGWSISDFDAGGSKVAMETLELAHSGFLQDDKALP